MQNFINLTTSIISQKKLKLSKICAGNKIISLGKYDLEGKKLIAIGNFFICEHVLVLIIFGII